MHKNINILEQKNHVDIQLIHVLWYPAGDKVELRLSADGAAVSFGTDNIILEQQKHYLLNPSMFVLTPCT